METQQPLYSNYNFEEKTTSIFDEFLKTLRKVLTFGLFQRGGIVRGPQQAIIGENGAEAVVPLEGKNKKYGAQILQKILPMFGMQEGGIVGEPITPTPIDIGEQPITLSLIHI